MRMLPTVELDPSEDIRYTLFVSRSGRKDGL